MSGRHWLKIVRLKKTWDKQSGSSFFGYIFFICIGLFGTTQLVAAGEPISKKTLSVSKTFISPPSTSNIPRPNLITLDSPDSKKMSPRVAIIIDDIGYNFERGIQAANLPGAVTLSVIPHTPHSISLANKAHRNGKEIMLHAPMSNLLDKPLDDGALSYDMGYFSFRETLKQSLKAVPHVKGVNNHMGSLLTQQEAPMRWLMEELGAQKLFFIDSRTSSESVAWEIAREENIPSAKRDVFLDNDRDPISIAGQFEKFVSQALDQGTAIAIAHPYPETLGFLEQTLPKLNNLNIHLVPVSSLLSPLNYAQKTTSLPRKPAIDGASDYFSVFLMQTTE